MITGHQNTAYRGKKKNQNQKTKKTATIHAFTSDCKHNIEFWNNGEIITASFLAPKIAAFQALATPKELGYGLTKKTNVNS